MKYFLLFLFLVVLSCNSKQYMKAGTISLMLYVYNDPDDNLFDSYEIPVSDLYFYWDRFIEKVPDMPGFVLISNDTYSVVRDLSNLDDVVSNGSLINKSFGAAFVDTVFPNYTNRIDLTDTVINGLSYKRVRIITEEDYSIFYINETDTILPYSLSKQFDIDYEGILSRIDSYNYHSGKFYSLRMSFKTELPETIYETFKSY
ncbi:hypothetical protein [Sunxiuqinia elliptica]|uniref:Uncharacterized protein n=1 Tax=Sunxiuqinia elliptica TaxID=655355 RepID=A0A4R6H1Z4_9BACT|nr:hypothetical protein [Sunxiuqinia elliptica]TDO01391.1 hypothetical protein DET52_105250 [Sunxiuqinia elliptica]TDO57902.1 hypothetical protein DET65_3499 [Sunxiuqinia elliptica]